MHLALIVIARKMKLTEQRPNFIFSPLMGAVHIKELKQLIELNLSRLRSVHGNKDIFCIRDELMVSQ
jgi:hypothetical protein